MELVKSQKDKNNLILNGYRLRKDRVNSDGSTSWRCVVKLCKGRVKVDSSGTLTNITDHDHPPDPEGVEATKVVANIRHRAATNVEKPRQIVQQCTAGLPLACASHLPSYTASQRTIGRVRKKAGQPSAAVNSLGDITMPNAMVITTRGDNFLIWDSGADDASRILVFGTLQNLALLETNRNWFIDGTFKVSPSVFCQVFTIQALLGTAVLPMVYALLPDKTEHSYTRLFQKLAELQPSLNPLSIMADYEKASQNACVHVFPAVKVVGCLFHLGQSLWRKVQEVHLADEYTNDADIRIHVKMILALSFVPPTDVASAFEDLVDDCPQQLQPITDYWEDVYIGRRRRRSRNRPLFAVDLWNVLDRLNDNLPRTNNSVEAWHRAFQVRA